VVLATAHTSPDHSREAWNKLVQTYRQAIYGYIRHRGYSSSDAEDLTQEFFLTLFSKRAFRSATPNRGRFRSFLLVCLNRFLISRHRRSLAAFRKPQYNSVSYDAPGAEAAFQADLVNYATPESLFEHQWAVALLDSTLEELRKHYKEQGNEALYEKIVVHLVGSGETPYAQIATQLHLSEPAVKTAVYRLRLRFRHLFREAVAATVPAEDVDSELTHLLATLSG
jgi:RNA polymerase sigma-70 factor (ECF subfamily)